MAEMSAVMSAACAFASPARLLRVRVRLKTWRLRRARCWVWRARLAADLVLAMKKIAGGSVTDAPGFVNRDAARLSPSVSQRGRGVGLLCRRRRRLGRERR